MENSDEDKKPVLLMGRDISKIPCFRNTFLYGISGGIGAGLVTFMFTSRPQFSTHMAVASFGVICTCYWIQCRYRFSQTKFKLAQLKAGMQKHVMYEGTELAKEVQKGNAKDA